MDGWWLLISHRGAAMLGATLGVIATAILAAGARAERIEQSAKRGDDGDRPVFPPPQDHLGRPHASTWKERGWSPVTRDHSIPWPPPHGPELTEDHELGIGA